MADDSHDGFAENLGSFIKLTGVTIPARARFIGEAMASASLTGLSIGVICGHVGATAITGPLVPFLWGTWIGSGLGFWRYWKSSIRYAEMCAEHYPELMVHSLWANHQMIVPRTAIQENVGLLPWMHQGGLGRFTWCVLAAKDCRSSVQEIESNRRQALIEKLSGED